MVLKRMGNIIGEKLKFYLVAEFFECQFLLREEFSLSSVKITNSNWNHGTKPVFVDLVN